MDLAVIGAGCVGLTSAACLAEIGHQVVCADNNLEKLKLLQSGGLPFYEPHLGPVVERNRRSGRLAFTSTPEAIEKSVAIFICVGTPPLDNGEADLTSIEGVARDIAQCARGYKLVVEKSTVPVQTGNQLQRQLGLYNRGEFRYDVASNPEFLREGSAMEDFFHPDRIVVGVENLTSAKLLEEIYQPILKQDFVCPVHASCRTPDPVPFVVADIPSAEIIKHASNSFLAMKISFINLMADLCEAAGADIDKVARGIGLDRRIGSSFLRPGVGFGGFCFPKDLQSFVRIGEMFGLDFSLLKEVENINLRRADQFVERVKQELWVLRGKRIGIWGLAFKPHTDDVRLAPSLAIARRLLAEGAVVSAYDPHASRNAQAELSGIGYCGDLYEAVEGAEALLILTEWEEFGQADLKRVHGLMARPLIADGRNVFSPDTVASHGFQYLGVGRSVTAPSAMTV
ncbi:MAG: UDP-glucose dehydrogenase family protein [Terriglobia bacterium]